MALPALAPPGSLDVAQPLGSQSISEGDDWIRYVQNVLKTYFPGITGIVTPTHTELNYVDGVTSLIQTQLDAKATMAQLDSVTATGALPLTLVTATTVAATEGNHYALTNVGLSTVTLPAAPTAGGTVRVTPVNALATNVIARNGLNIMSLAEDMTIDNASASVTLRYINSTVGWRII